MLEARERTRDELKGLRVAWARLEKQGETSGGLPAPDLEVPDREPDRLDRDPVAHAYRAFYRALGLDPDETHPRGEDLARRLATGEPLPGDRGIVRVVNLASAVTLVPIHVFDEDRLEPPLRLEISKGETRFETGRGHAHTVKQGFPLVADGQGPIAMLAHRDGARASPSEDTEKALVFFCGPPVTAPRVLPDALRQVERYAELIAWTFLTRPEIRCLEPGT